MADPKQPPSTPYRPQPTPPPRTLPTIEVKRSPRVTKLTEALLGCYDGIQTALNNLSSLKVMEEEKKSRLADYEHSVYREQRTLDELVAKARNFIGEIDAVAGAQGFHCPDELKELIGKPTTWRRTVSGSLSKLAYAPYYIDEEYIQPSTVYEGQKGHANLIANGRFEAIAFSINRIRYLQECKKTDNALYAHEEKLYQQVEAVIKYAGSGTLMMPSNLREAAGRILSDSLNEATDQESEDSDYEETPRDAEIRRAEYVKGLEEREKWNFDNFDELERRLDQRLRDLERMEEEAGEEDEEDEDDE